MDGIFSRKKFSIWLLVSFVEALLLVGLYIWIIIDEPNAIADATLLLIVGALIFAAVVISWLCNFGAYIRIDDNSIKAKYHWFNKIDCKLSDVDFAFSAGNTLTIQLKGGKKHTIIGVVNSWELASAIRRKLVFESIEDLQTMKNKLKKLKLAKLRGVVYVCVCLALMFINLFVTALLTGSRELEEFSKTDWAVFVFMMGVVETLIIITTFYFAFRTGKNNVPIEKMHYQLQKRIIETNTLLPGNVVKVYTDENYKARITVFGYPNDGSVYFIIEQLTTDYSLIKAYETEIFEDINEFSEMFEQWIDITEKVLH